LSSASGAGPSIKIGSATINVTSSTKPSIGINPIFKISNAKASSAEPLIKNNSPAKAVSSARVSSSINKSGANKPLFVSKEESVTKLPVKKAGSAKLSKPNGKKAKSVLPRQDALKPATRLLIIIPPLTRLLATTPAALEYILKVFESVESDIDLSNLDF